MLELRTALAKKIPVDSLDPWGDTALHLATRVGLLVWEEFCSSRSSVSIQNYTEPLLVPCNNSQY